MSFLFCLFLLSFILCFFSTCCFWSDIEQTDSEEGADQYCQCPVFVFPYVFVFLFVFFFVDRERVRYRIQTREMQEQTNIISILSLYSTLSLSLYLSFFFFILDREKVRQRTDRSGRQEQTNIVSVPSHNCHFHHLL